MGIEDVFVVDGGVHAWAGAGLALEEGAPEESPFGLEGAWAAVPAVTPEELAAQDDAVVLYVDTSQEFASGHVPGARWIARGWLELRIGDLGVERDAPVVVTCADGRASALAGLTLYGLGYTYVSYLEGGMAAWREAGLPVERGLTGVMAMPGDIPADTVIAGPERSYADTVTYLRWEIALGDKYKE